MAYQPSNESAHAPLIKSHGKAIVHNECLPVYRSLLGFANYYRKPDNTHALSIGIFIYCKMYRFIIAKAIAIEQTYKPGSVVFIIYYNLSTTQ